MECGKLKSGTQLRGVHEIYVELKNIFCKVEKEQNKENQELQLPLKNSRSPKK
jgi:hypothetical protein